MANELTYILGAGASYESIPLVKSFPSRFNEFCKFLIESTGTGTRDSEFINKFQFAWGKAKDASLAFSNHQSFDTYFKKLFHTGQKDKIKEAKKILNLYFTWEHLTMPKKEMQNSEMNPNGFEKKSLVDKRYDALIAGLLKPIDGNPEPFIPINFITWNYDLNLFLSIKNYFSPNASIKEFLESIEISRNVWKIGNAITVINLNGFFYNNYLSSFKDIDDALKRAYLLEEIIYSKLSQKNFFGDYVDTDSEMVKFAWESIAENEMGKMESLEQAKSKVLLSDNIVVIGYTFPLYNRLIDYKYFSKKIVSGKTIYIQDPDAAKLISSVRDNFSIEINSTNEPIRGYTSMNAIENCDYFFVPKAIFPFDFLNKNKRPSVVEVPQ